MSYFDKTPERMRYEARRALGFADDVFGKDWWKTSTERQIRERLTAWNLNALRRTGDGSDDPALIEFFGHEIDTMCLILGERGMVRDTSIGYLGPISGLRARTE